MIQLKDDTEVALLMALMKQNYGISWFSKDGGLSVGMHLPTGEVAYSVPASYLKYLSGMIELEKPDNLDDVTEQEMADRLLEWTKEL
jgi:hypothetical protein